MGMDSSCGSPREGTCVITWHVNQDCTAMIRLHQIPESTKQTEEVVIREPLCVWSTNLVLRFRAWLLADSHRPSFYVISQQDNCSFANRMSLEFGEDARWIKRGGFGAIKILLCIHFCVKLRSIRWEYDGHSLCLQSSASSGEKNVTFFRQGIL